MTARAERSSLRCLKPLARIHSRAFDRYTFPCSLLLPPAALASKAPKSHQKRLGALSARAQRPQTLRAHVRFASRLREHGGVFGWEKAIPSRLVSVAHSAEGSGETCATLPPRFPGGFGYFCRPKVPTGAGQAKSCPMLRRRHPFLGSPTGTAVQRTRDGEGHRGGSRIPRVYCPPSSN